ncbi:MAG: DNA translocase FtsK 4TM domain-containing protein, partial [Thermodesulfobacteriota bacterium]|nr:DNA translocase FtsK 4TM domain-containing protein [Thermodesulfobacteriota bacterium]
MAQAKKNEFMFRQEITALVCLFLGVFFLLCLVSYALPLLADPPALQDPGANWCGGFGYYVAHYLFSFLGITSFFPILVFFYLAAAAFLPHTHINRLPSIIAGITGILLAASGLLATTQQLIIPPEFITPGGYLGNLVRGLLESVVGAVGSVLLLVLLLIFSLMAAVRFSPFLSGGWLWKQTVLLFKNAPAKRPKLQSRTSKKSRRATEPAVSLPDSNSELLQNPDPVQGIPAVHEPVRRE